VLSSFDEFDNADILMPKDIFAITNSGARMPAQVLLQACDTSAVSDTRSGEWLTIAPAFVAGGAREVLATLYPILDDGAASDLSSTGHDPLIGAAIAGESLSAALWEYQRGKSKIWLSKGNSHLGDSPLVWGAYAPIVVNKRPASSRQPSVRNFSEGAVWLIASALDDFKRPIVTSDQLLAAYFGDNALDAILGGASLSLNPASWIWTVGTQVIPVVGRFKEVRRRWATNDCGCRRHISAVVKQTILIAGRQASLDGRLVQKEDLIIAVLTMRYSAAAAVISTLCRVTRRREALLTRAIEHLRDVAVAEGNARIAKRDSSKVECWGEAYDLVQSMLDEN
jgi:CHAT domain